MPKTNLVRLVPALALVAGALVFSDGTPASAASSCTGKKETRSADNWSSTEVNLCLAASKKGWSHGTINFTCWIGQTIGWDRTDCTLSGAAILTKTQDGTTQRVYTKPIALKYTYSTNGDSATYAQNFTFNCTPGATYSFTLKNAHTVHNTLDKYKGRIDLPDHAISDIACN